MLLEPLGLLPTSGITDPHVRKYLDRLAAVLDERSNGDNRFISSGEFNQMVGNVVAGIASGGVTGGNGAAPGPTGSLETLTQAIRSSIVFQLLEQQVSVDDINAVRAHLDGAFAEAQAGMTAEAERRTTETTSLASAINKIWSLVGGSTAVISDGVLATTNPSAATATKWNQVIAAVTDPNTGNVNSASILQETRTYANNTDSTLNALYTVRAQVSSGGQTIVGGFGLAATSGAGSAQGPTIDFIVRADKFAIAATASTPSVAAQLADLTTPFMVVTAPTTVGGVTYQPGTYIKNAFIGKLTAGQLTVRALSDTMNSGASAGGRIEMVTNAIKVFDEANVKRVQLGDLQA
jgi:hypothetical protein